MDDRQDSLGNIWKGGAIVLVTFALTLGIYFACTRFFDSTKNHFKPLARWSEPADPVAGGQRQAGGGGAAYSPVAPRVANLPPRVTGGSAAPPGYGIPLRPLTTNPPILPRPIVTVQYDPDRLYFSDAVKQRRAQEAVLSLRVTIDGIRKLDGSSFWAQLPAGSQAGELTAQTTVPEDPATGRLFAADTEDAARKRQRVVARIINETEAMATELALVAHPDHFPEALREQVKQISTEARIYLSTVQLALSRPEERDGMRTLAQGHLSRCESLLRNAQHVVGIL